MVSDRLLSRTMTPSHHRDPVLWAEDRRPTTPGFGASDPLSDKTPGPTQLKRRVGQVKVPDLVVPASSRTGTR